MPKGIYKRSQQQKDNMRRIKTGTKLSKETKDKIRNKLLGHEVLETTRKKLSIANIGKKISEETINKIKSKTTGKPHGRTNTVKKNRVIIQEMLREKINITYANMENKDGMDNES